MLDFYSISDSSNPPEYPDEDLYIGSLSMEEHRLLSAMLLEFQVNYTIPYHEDSRHNSTVAKNIYSSLEGILGHTLLEKTENSKLFDRFLDMMKLVVERQVGFFVFCD